MVSKTYNAAAVTAEIRGFTAGSPLNRMPGTGGEVIFEEPLVQFADGDDPIFNEYKRIIAPDHLTPREALASIYNMAPEALPEKLAVISWVLPITLATRASNRRETRAPSRYWSHTRWYGEIFNEALRDHVVEFLKGRGYQSGAPASRPHVKYYFENGMRSSWSERHIAYAAGLGSFGLSDGFITEKGMAHRCGSVVTDMPLPVSRRTVPGPYANCLFYVSGECGQCIRRCPAGAITEKGHDKQKCSDYCRDLGFKPMEPYDPAVSVAGCGLCQTKVMCEAVNPTHKTASSAGKK